MGDNTLYTFAAPEIAEFLHSNGVNLVDLLVHDGFDVREGASSDLSEAGAKDATMVILASAAVIATMQPALKRLLEGLLYRPIRVTELAPVEMTEEGTGGSDGAPKKIVWVEHTSIHENPLPKEKTKLVVGFAGFKFEYETDVGQQ